MSDGQTAAPGGVKVSCQAPGPGAEGSGPSESVVGGKQLPPTESGPTRQLSTEPAFRLKGLLLH